MINDISLSSRPVVALITVSGVSGVSPVSPVSPVSAGDAVRPDIAERTLKSHPEYAELNSDDP